VSRSRSCPPSPLPQSHPLAAVLLLVALGAPGTRACPQTDGPVGEGLPLGAATARMLVEEVSGEIALHHVRAISRFHRIQASPMMREAAEYVRGELVACGLADAVVERYPSDGRRAYQTWLSPVGWTVEEAELWMVSPERRRLARFSEIAVSLVTLSTSADEEGVLLDAGTGTDPAFYDSTDVRGRIVLASGYGGDVHRLAVLRHGALGVVCWNDNPDRPDQVRYTGMWPKAGERERVRWGFNVSYRTGQELRERLADGEEVRLHARVVEGRLQDGELVNVTATIPGSRYPGREIVLMAHLDHPRPSANDNASGSAALLEIARALRRLIVQGRLAPPERTIRFLWVAEMYGTAAWLDAHPETADRTAFAINLDMVGAPPGAGRLLLYRDPPSTASILDTVIEEAACWIAGLQVREPRGTAGPLAWEAVPYSGGSDHYMFIDGAVGVPSVMLNNSPDPYYHSSEDTPERIDPTALKRSALIAASTAWALASLSPDRADGLLRVHVATSLARLARDQYRVVDLLEGLDRSRDNTASALLVRDAGLVLEAQLDRELHSAGTLLRLLPADADSVELAGLTAAVTRARAQLDEYGALCRERVMEVELERIARARGMFPLPQLLPIAPLPERDTASNLVYRRTTRGPINDDWLLDRLSAERREWYLEGAGAELWRQGTLRYEIVNYVDGNRSALEIRNAVSASWGLQPIDRVVDYLKDLETAGLLLATRGRNGR
jgi:aminopeptidase YwaD